MKTLYYISILYVCGFMEPSSRSWIGAQIKLLLDISLLLVEVVNVISFVNWLLLDISFLSVNAWLILLL